MNGKAVQTNCMYIYEKKLCLLNGNFFGYFLYFFLFRQVQF